MGDTTEAQAHGPHALITDDHVKETLKADKGIWAQLLSWTIVDFTKKGDNFATFVTSVKVKFIDKGETKTISYIVKLNPCRDIEDMEIFVIQLFAKEAGFYRDLLPELNSVLESLGQPPLRVAKCYHFCLEKGKEILFLEDLRPKGYKLNGAGFSGTDLVHSTLILKELARLHSASWVLQKKRPTEDMGNKYEFLKDETFKPSEPGGKYLNRMLIRGNAITTTLLEHIGGYDKMVNWITKRKTSPVDIIYDMIQRSPPFDVFCHGDVHANNVLFRYNDHGEPEEVMLLDFQINRIASLATDINYFLFLNLTGEVRKPNVDTLLENYFQSFKEISNGSGEMMPFSRQELNQEFRNKHLYALTFVMGIASLMVVPPSEMPDPEELFSSTDPEATEEEKRKYAKACDDNHDLRKKFLATFDEMNMVGVFDS